MARPKVVGEDTLDQWVGETTLQHRCLLLYAMQDPKFDPKIKGGHVGRNLAIIVTISGRGRATVRKWQDKRRWEDRINGHGRDAQAYAIELYRHLYMEKHGKADLPHVAAMVSLPMTTAAPEGVETDVQEEAVRLVRKLVPPAPPPDVQEKVKRAVDKKRDDAAKANRVITGIAYAALGAVNDAVKAATDPKFRKANPHVQPIRVRLADLGKIHDVLRSLREEADRLENPEIHANGGPLVDSVRVKIAKETGGSLVLAMRDDAHELVAILDAMAAPVMSAAEVDEQQAPAEDTEQEASS